MFVSQRVSPAEVNETAYEMESEKDKNANEGNDTGASTVESKTEPSYPSGTTTSTGAIAASFVPPADQEERNLTNDHPKSNVTDPNETQHSPLRSLVTTHCTIQRESPKLSNLPTVALKTSSKSCGNSESHDPENSSKMTDSEGNSGDSKLLKIDDPHSHASDEDMSSRTSHSQKVSTNEGQLVESLQLLNEASSDDPNGDNDCISSINTHGSLIEAGGELERNQRNLPLLKSNMHSVRFEFNRRMSLVKDMQTGRESTRGHRAVSLCCKDRC